MMTQTIRVAIYAALSSTLFMFACASPQAVEEYSKEKAASEVAKGDSYRDVCSEYGWYGDGECDDFCSRPDEDCEAEVAFCTSVLCAPNTRCSEEERRCAPVVGGFCATALCGPGTECSEEERRCVPRETDSFCATALCGPGTVCNEDTDSCDPATCENTCPWAGDGECDDGGPGSDFSVCELGSDCSDCGLR